VEGHGGQGCKKDQCRQQILVPRAPGMHSGHERGVVAIQSNCHQLFGHEVMVMVYSCIFVIQTFLPRTPWVPLNPLRTGVGRFRSCLHKWCVASSAALSMAYKNKPSTILSSNIQPIDLPMDCMAWRFWTMRQSNGCSTPAPRSSTA